MFVWFLLGGSFLILCISQVSCHKVKRSDTLVCKEGTAEQQEQSSVWTMRLWGRGLTGKEKIFRPHIMPVRAPKFYSQESGENKWRGSFPSIWTTPSQENTKKLILIAECLTCISDLLLISSYNLNGPISIHLYFVTCLHGIPCSRAYLVALAAGWQLP